MPFASQPKWGPPCSFVVGFPKEILVGGPEGCEGLKGPLPEGSSTEQPSVAKDNESSVFRAVGSENASVHNESGFSLLRSERESSFSMPRNHLSSEPPHRRWAVPGCKRSLLTEGWWFKVASFACLPRIEVKFRTCVAVWFICFFVYFSSFFLSSAVLFTF